MTGLGIHDLALFSLTVLVLNATPGVDMLYAVSRTLTGGLRAGLAAALGISAGCVVHALLAAFGLAALLAVSAWAFSAIKWAGAAYLVWLGVGMLREAFRHGNGRAAAVAADPRVTAFAIFRQGLLTNVLNPKVALFFLAFLPQFIAPESEHKALAFLALGGWLLVQSLFFLIALVAVTAWLRRLGGSPRLARLLNGVGGLLFLGLAAKLAQTQAQPS
jgi:threonine/homoserine/homoserine lactone efflux protein